MNKAEQFLNIALGGNMNISTLKPKVFIEIMTDFANKHSTEQLILHGVTKRFSPKETQNVLRKVKRAKIRTDLKNTLINHFGIENYNDRDGDDFFKKYTGKEVNVYEWCNDWWIAEDDNYPITLECFDFIN